jgi:lipoprotein signal peptidase
MLDRAALPENPSQTRPRLLLAILLVVGGLAFVTDQGGKWWAFTASREPADLREIAPGVFAGAQGRNYGGMFSLDGNEASWLPRIVLTGLGFLTIALLFRGAVRDCNRWRVIHAVGGGLVFAGALGNQVDRLCWDTSATI